METREEKKEGMSINLFYLLTLGPLFICTALLWYGEREIINISFFLLGYVWNMPQVTPGIEEKIEKKNYRFSTLRWCYLFSNFLESNFLSFMQSLKLSPSFSSSSSPASLLLGQVLKIFQIKLFYRLIPPLIFGLLYWFIFNVGNILWIILGSLSFEGVYAGGRKVYGDLVVRKRRSKN